jgi:hypothetical protein
MAGLRTMGAVSKQVAATGRSVRQAASDSAALGAVGTIAAKNMAEQVFEFEKVGNAIEAVTDLTAGQREELEQLSRDLNALYPATNVDIMQAALELAKSGMTFEQIRGSLANTLNLAFAGDFGFKESSSYLIATATAMRLAMGTEEEAAASTAKIADMMAYAANRSLAEIPDLGVTLKYVAAAAAATGMSVEELGASLTVLANNGMMGSNAGTGLRYALLQLINPSKAASEAFAKLNIDLGDYVTGAQKINASDLITNLGMDGIHIEEMGLDKQIQAALDDPAIAKSPAKLVSRLSELINQAVGDQGIVDQTALANSLSESLTVLGTQVDLVGLMKAFQSNPQSEALFGAIFGKQHAVKMMAFLAGDLAGTTADFEQNMDGAASEMSSKRLKGVVGDWYELTASIENFVLTLADTGLLNDAVKGLQELVKLVDTISVINPQALRLGAYAFLALTALAPIGFAISGVASALALMSNPITIVAAALGYLAFQNWDGLNAFWNNLTKFFTQGLTPEATALFSEVVLWIEQLPNALNSLGDGFDFAGWGQTVGTTLADLVNKVPDFLKFLEKLRSDAQPILDTITPIFISFGNAVVAIVGAVGNLTKTAADGAVSFFTGLTEGIDPATMEILGRWGTTIADFATGLWDLITGIAEAIANADMSGFSEFMRLLGQAFGVGLSIEITVLDQVIKFLTDIPTHVTNAIAKIEELRTFLQTAFDNIDLFAAGKAIIDSLINGIIAAVPFLRETIDSIGGLLNSIKPGGMGGNGTGGQGGKMFGDLNGDPGLPNPAAPLDGARAEGGPLWNGWFLAGEKGPELGYASGKGHMFNAAETKRMLTGANSNGGGVTNHNTFHIQSNDPEAVANAVARRLDSSLQRSRGLSMEDRPTFG